MIPSRIEKCIIKYISKSATSKDFDTLLKWVEYPNNRLIFKEYLKDHYAIMFSINDPDAKDVTEKVLKEIRNEKYRMHRRRFQNVFKYAAAAIFIGLLISGFFFKDKFLNGTEEETPEVITNNIIVPGSDKATLTLDDGSQIALEEGKSYEKGNVKSDGEKIVYTSGKSKVSNIEYHYLTIPRGGEFFLILPDGTKVWLNSDSQLKYPVSFIEGEKRKVELVYGEAYFDVSPSAEHNGSEFIVSNQYQQVEVLGTEFNVKAYKDESNIYTTLAEGNVVVHFDGFERQNITPGQQSNWNPYVKEFSVDIVNVYNEISWRYGVFSFDGKPLKEIVKTLSRWYDVDFIFLNKTIGDVEFVGVLRKNKKLEDIILNLKNFGVIEGYKIKNKTIIIK